MDQSVLSQAVAAKRINQPTYDCQMQNLVFVIVSLALVIALVFALSFLDRLDITSRVRATWVGIVAGLCAFAAMMDPLVISEGVLIDGRNVFLGLAAATTGPLAAFVALLLSGFTRIYLGGLGMAVGLSSMVFCVLAGLVWRKLDDLIYVSERWRWPLFGLVLCLSIPFVLMLPEPLGLQAMRDGGLGQALVYLAGSSLFGLMLTREQKFIEQHHNLEIDADIDPLTKALNRRGLEKRFAQHCEDFGEGSCFVGVIDVDNFKMINDRFGHDVGDLALCEVATSLKRCTRSNDIIARIGGDEFALIAFDLTKNQATAFHARLEETLQKDLKIIVPGRNRELPFSATLGVAYHESTLPRLDALLEGADKQMLRRKRDFRAMPQESFARHDALPRTKGQDGGSVGNPVETRSNRTYAHQRRYRIRADIG